MKTPSRPLRVVLGVTTGLLVASHTVYAQPTVTERDQRTPEPMTPVWKAERDLVVLLENSDDRIALSKLIRDRSLDAAAPLTDQQRFDGLFIAGQTLWREAMYADCLTCFDGIIDLDFSEYRTIDAYRMKAQCHFFLNQFAESTHAYLMCYNLSKSLEANVPGSSMHTLIANMLATSAIYQGDPELAYQIADEFVADPQSFNAADELLYTVGQKAYRDGDFEAADHYLTLLLDHFPDFGTEAPGVRVLIKIRQYKARGLSVEDYDPAALETVLDLVADEHYQGMMMWGHAVNELALVFDAVNDYRRANKVRMWAVEVFKTSIDNLDPSDPAYEIDKESFEYIIRGLIWEAAEEYRRYEKHDEQIAMLERLREWVPEEETQMMHTIDVHIRIAEHKRDK